MKCVDDVSDVSLGVGSVFGVDGVECSEFNGDVV